MAPSWPCFCTYRLQESPKLSPANGTPGIVLAPQSCAGSPHPVRSKGAGEGLGMKGGFVGYQSAETLGQASAGGSQSWKPEKGCARQEGVCHCRWLVLGLVPGARGVQGSQQA